MEILATQQHWIEQQDDYFKIVCGVTGDTIEVERKILAELDLLARNKLCAESTQNLIDLGLAKEVITQDYCKPKIGVVVTVSNPPQEFNNILLNHYHNFCEKFYVFNDSPDIELNLPAELTDVLEVISDQEVDMKNKIYRRHLQFFEKEVMSRQVWNVERALAMARRDKLDWLFHLDEDELLVLPRGAETLSTVPPEIGSVVIMNDEVVVQELEYNCYVEDTRLFKKSPRLMPRTQAAKTRRKIGREHFYTAYTNGKSGVRVGDGAHPHGVHRFIPPTNFSNVSLLPGARVLHYANCGFQNFLRKYQLRQSMSDQYFERKRRIGFHLQARDALLDGGVEGLKQYYVRNVLFSASQVQTLVTENTVEKWTID